MAKWSGVIGFAGEATESSPSVYTEPIVEKKYYGDIIKNSRKISYGDKVNPNISVNNSISVIADPYAMNHFFSIRYATYCGIKWTVSEVTVDHPRLILTLGEVYNGQST